MSAVSKGFSFGFDLGTTESGFRVASILPGGGDETRWVLPPAAGAGSWSDPVNWSIAVPTAAFGATIDNGGTAVIDTPGEACGRVRRPHDRRRADRPGTD